VILALLMIPLAPALAQDSQPKIKAMTRNLYLGADIFKVVEAARENPDDPLAVPIAVSELYQTMLFTNFWARAEAIADEIEEKNPDVIGLQEVSQYFKQTPSDFVEGGTEPASFMVIDFYKVLNWQLKKRGLNYTKFEQTNANVELPMLDLKSPNFFSDVRMVDRDMVLVREDHEASIKDADNYTQNLGLELGGADLEFTRGFLIVDVVLQGEDFRFVNTHLEVRGEPGSPFRFFQFAQMAELLQRLGGYTAEDPKTIIMLGDFNSSPEDVPGTAFLPDGSQIDYTPPYMLAVGAGYLDAWTEQNNYGDGFTSGFGEYISNPFDELTTRIDLIFVYPIGLSIDKVKCDVVGDKFWDMVPNPLMPRILRLWPSDHAGVVGKIKFMN
jgi:exonuclease III